MVKDGAGGRWRVFLSSTFFELKEYRRAVRDRCREEFSDKIKLIALDDDEYSRISLNAEVLSVGKLKTCDLVLLLIGRGLGSRTSEGHSYTEEEIRAAKRDGIRVIAFMLDDGAEELGPGASAQETGPGDREWWDQERERQFYLGVGAHSKIVSQPEVTLSNPSQLAEEVARKLGEWLEYHARPHRLRGTSDPDRPFVDREEPYRQLKRRVLAERVLRDGVLPGLISVVSGPSGTGKSTLTEALRADHDVARVYPAPMIELSVDLAFRSPAELFRAQLDQELAERSSPGARCLLVVTMSSVPDQKMSADEARSRIQKFLGNSFPNKDLLHQRCTTIFEVPQVRAVESICRYFGLTAAQAHIAVPDLSPQAALDLLFVQGGMHYDCAECMNLGRAVARAAGNWPPLLTLCARSFSLKQEHDQHEYLRHSGQAFNELLPDDEQMYQTFKGQMNLLTKEAQLLLSAAGVLLPGPFSFSESLIQAASGLEKKAVKRALDALVDHGYVKRAERARSDGGTEREFTIHPFFWVFLRRQHEVALSAGGPAGQQTTELHTSAFGWLDHEVDLKVENDLTYRGWFELESPERQGLISNWVYQLARLDDRRKAAEELARIFLKAQWWWGCYLPFSFCDLLCELGASALDWSAREDDDDLSVVTQAIGVIYQNYPPEGEFDKRLKAADARTAWTRTKEALLRIARQLEIPVDDDVAAVRCRALKGAASADPRRAKARDQIALFLHQFLSECEQCFRGETVIDDRALREVERHSKSALAIAEHQKDEWDQHWIWADLAAAEVEAARARHRSPKAFRRTEAACLEKAQEHAQKGLRLARKLGKNDVDLDFEVISVCEWLKGDIDWLRGARETAAGHYARAIHYAHCFEVWPEHQPDRYTRTFEREQRWLVSTRLLELADAAGDDPALRTVTGRIAEFLGSDPSSAGERVTRVAARGKWKEEPGTAVDELFLPYRLPPEIELERRNDTEKRMVDKFRSDAVEMIRSTERRYPDLISLPDKLGP
jgi:hypothetical protein